ncbi:MAG: hypothetical protein R2912_10865 [Eubacteriales bacterium]
MLTKWGQALDKTNVLPEYPRPQFRRSNCQILNGDWDYAITALTQLVPPERFEGNILVPFSPEASFPAWDERSSPTNVFGTAGNWKRRSALTQTRRI